MCGIFGIINRHDYDIDLLKKYFDYGKKRGPEYSEYKVIDKKITFPNQDNTIEISVDDIKKANLIREIKV